MKHHRGIRIDRIPVKGAAGFLFVVAVVAVFLIGIPATREFLLLALVGAIVFAVVLYIWRSQTRW